MSRVGTVNVSGMKCVSGAEVKDILVYATRIGGNDQHGGL